MLDQLHKMMTGELPAAPVAELLGIRGLEVIEGRVVVEMDATRQYANQMGTLNGGILCTLADTALACAFATTLEEGESFTTLDLKMNFLKPVWTATLRAVGTVKKKGQTIGLVECDIFDEQDSLVGSATSTCMVLRGQMASGR